MDPIINKVLALLETAEDKSAIVMIALKLQYYENIVFKSQQSKMIGQPGRWLFSEHNKFAKASNEI